MMDLSGGKLHLPPLEIVIHTNKTLLGWFLHRTTKMQAFRRLGRPQTLWGLDSRVWTRWVSLNKTQNNQIINFIREMGLRLLWFVFSRSIGSYRLLLLASTRDFSLMRGVKSLCSRLGGTERSFFLGSWMDVSVYFSFFLIRRIWDYFLNYIDGIFVDLGFEGECFWLPCQYFEMYFLLMLLSMVDPSLIVSHELFMTTNIWCVVPLLLCFRAFLFLLWNHFANKLTSRRFSYSSNLRCSLIRSSRYYCFSSYRPKKSFNFTLFSMRYECSFINERGR